MSTGSTPIGLPRPLMYGPSFPRIRMVMRDGLQYFESRTNQNLFLDDSDFTENGTFTMARFLRTLPPCKSCGDTRAKGEHVCSLVAGDVTWDDETPRGWEIKDKPDFVQCPGIDLLLGYCDSDAQKRFLTAYCLALSTPGFGFWFSLADGPEIVERAQLRRRELLRATERLALNQQLSFPALIPEAWLNAIGAERTVEDEEHLEENPQRVDFVLFPEGRRCVIEIDGPSHYATFDEGTRRYEVSEERYTRNLRIERSLRRHGWEIFRFSNFEVNNAEIPEFSKLVSHVTGAKQGTIDSPALRTVLTEYDPEHPNYVPF